MGIHLHHSHDHDHDHGQEHDHGHGHFHAVRSGGGVALTRALVVTVAFMFVELAGGIYANSLALTSDAAHMLTDVGAILLSLFAFWIARRPRTLVMSFGYHRAEILGALVSGVAIWFIAGALIYEAVQRLSSPPDVNGPVVFVIASLGLGANLFSMRMLHSSKSENINVRAAYLHMLADSLGSVGAVVAGGVLWLTGWRPIDPLITFLFSVLMVVGSWELLKESVGVLMESTPTGFDPARVHSALQAISGVQEVHDLHIWNVSSGRTALSVHLIAEKGDVLQLANDMLRESFKIIHTTIQIEHPDTFKSERCYDCKPGQ